MRYSNYYYVNVIMNNSNYPDVVSNDNCVFSLKILDVETGRKILNCIMMNNTNLQT